MAKKRRKTRTHLKGPNGPTQVAKNAPKSFVIRSGKVGKSVTGLVGDVRKTMEPNTATRLRERKSNKLRDFVAMSGPLGVSHLIIFNQTDAGINMRIGRCPRGPTCTFRVNKFSLMNDISRSQKRPRAPGTEFSTHPLLVLNNFGGESRHIKLLVTVFQNLFPPIQVQTMHLSQARRVVLLSYNAESGTIEWRHFLISVRPVGVSRSVRRVIEGTNKPGASANDANISKRKIKGLPNLGNVGDISEYVLGRAQRSGSTGATSDTDLSEAESELEDMADPNNTVELFQRYVGRGNAANEQRAVRLREIGPRMELRLMKIEDGMVGGETLYHDRVHKTAKEAAALKQSTSAKTKLKESRKAEQEANVERKKAEAAARKTKDKFAEAAASEIVDAEAEAALSDELADAGKDDDDDDEFEYEDRFGGDAQGDDDLFEDEADDLGADDDDVSLSEGEGGMEDEEDSESERSEKSFDDGDDDSDLSPIPMDGGMQGYSDSDEEDEDEEDLPAQSSSRAPAKKQKPMPSGRKPGKGKGRR